MSTLLELNRPVSPCEVKKVKSVTFRLFDPEHVRRFSVCEITNSDLYTDGKPSENGLHDMRMGVTDLASVCATCNGDSRTCPGHFGHIELNKPVYNYAFIKTVLNVLRSVCTSCGLLLAHPDDSRFQQIYKIANPHQRLAKIAQLCANILHCPVTQVQEGVTVGCGSAQPQFWRDGIDILINYARTTSNRDNVELGDDSKRIFTAEAALRVFKKISDDHARLLGFNPESSRPEWLLIKALIVIPPCVRPPVQFGSDRSEDGLTAKLNDIIMVNRQLKRFETEGAAAHVIAETHKLLHYHVATLMDNEISGLPTATTRGHTPIKSLRERLKGKEGRLRGNLMGKRVDFSARTVITGDPNIAIDEVGVPLSIAMNLTYPEIVTADNIEELRAAVKNGPGIWPGANYVIRRDGVRFDIRHATGGANALTLETGYIVERHLRDGDYVLFNRQPSLHKMSIMGHRVKVMHWNTFRVNLSVTSPYNADFDGDEMNLHVAQSHEARSEIKHICAVPHQIISPQGNKPVVGIVQDSLLAVSRLTSRDIFVDKRTLMSLCMTLPNWNGQLPAPTIWKPQLLWTGKQLFTLTLLADIDETGSNDTGLSSDFNKNKTHQANIHYGHNSIAPTNHLFLQRDSNCRIKNDNIYHSKVDSRVIIQQGELLAGVIDKKTVGATANGLIHVLWHQCGVLKTIDFLSAIQRLTNAWMLTQGFTVGVSDITVSQKTRNKIEDELLKVEQTVNELILSARAGTVENQPGKDLLSSFEARVNSELNAAREISGSIAADALDDRNNIIAMVLAGSKGSTINVSQIMACVGQQNVEGNRIPFGFESRSLPHFCKYDFGPDSRGFVRSSYLKGLNPWELFFHAMGGREGIIDTACKTSETGYIQRRLVKAMEDVQVMYDSTVRNSKNEVIQFSYGEDGFRAEFIEHQSLPLIKKNFFEIEQTYRHNIHDPDYGKGWLSDKTLQELKSNFNDDLLTTEYDSICETKQNLAKVFGDTDDFQPLSINFQRLISIAKSLYPRLDQSDDMLCPRDVCQRVKACIDKLKPYGATLLNDHDHMMNSLLFKAHVQSNLNSLVLLRDHKISSRALDWLLQETMSAYRRSMSQPGEVVGALAAQSIGEPATQMTLNTFHFAGVGSKNVTLGVPRLRELINAAQNVATPSLTIHLDDNIASDSTKAKEVQSRIEYTVFGRFITNASIIYDVDIMNTAVTEDAEWVQDYYALNDIDGSLCSTLSSWLLRLKISNRLITEGLRLSEVGQKIRTAFEPYGLHIIWSDDNAENLVMRIRPHLNNNRNSDSNAKQYSENLLSEICETVPELSQHQSEAAMNFINSRQQVSALTHLAQILLPRFKLCGVVGITKVYMREERYSIYDQTTGSFSKPKTHWVLDTDGINLADVLPVDGVKFSKTISNSIREMNSVLGIEAARRSLLNEIRSVISFDGSYVNFRHLATLCDVMTHRATLMPITRNGINKAGKGVLAKCSFEQTVEVIAQAATFSQNDKLSGVTEAVVFGQLANFGTGCCEVVIDSAKLKDPVLRFASTQQALLSSLNMTENEDRLKELNQAKFNNDNICSPFSPFTPSSPSAGSVVSPGIGVFSPSLAAFSPMPLGGNNNIFSPTQGPFSPGGFGAQPLFSPGGPTSNNFNPMSPGLYNNILSPTYSPTSPNNLLSPRYSPTSPGLNMANAQYNPASPSLLSPKYSPTSPGGLISPSVMYNPASPNALNTAAPFSPMSKDAFAFNVNAPFSPGGLMSPQNKSAVDFKAMSPGAYSPSANLYSPCAAVVNPELEPTNAINAEMLQSPRYSPIAMFAVDEAESSDNEEHK